MIKSTLRSFFPSRDEEQLYAGIVNCYGDENSMINFDSFMRAAGEACGADTSLYNIAFLMFDTDGDGQISREEMAGVVEVSSVQFSRPCDNQRRLDYSLIAVGMKPLLRRMSF